MPPENGRARPAGSKNSESQGGYSVFDTVNAIAIVGVLVAPMIGATSSLMDATRAMVTESALATAGDALVAYAAAHNGCLPFAADSEGALPDTDQGGNPSPDTGVGVVNTFAGDLPWSELGLTTTFLDGDKLRIQYYVASPYTDADTSDDVICPAGSRGSLWDPSLTYDGSGPPRYLYLYYTPAGSELQLYKVLGDLPAGKSPDTANPSDVRNITAPLPDALLEVRRGPDITGKFGLQEQSDRLSSQNVFVLIAAGKNRNALLDRTHIRDANHAGNAAGGPWTVNNSDADGVVFAGTRDLDATIDIDYGDDTLLVMSITNFMVKVSKYHLIVGPICAGSC